MTAQPGILFGGGVSIFFILMWLTSIGLGIYAFVLLVKLARRGIVALDLYNYAKNLEIRDRYQSANRDDAAKYMNGN